MPQADGRDADGRAADRDADDCDAGHWATDDRPVRVLVLNHHRDPLEPVLAGLRRARYEVRESRSLAESHGLLDSVEPDVAILNPLVLKHGGVEFELVERLQRPERPVPVILLVDGPSQLESARRLEVPISDFAYKPPSLDECLLRVESKLRHRDQLLRLQQRTRELEGQISTDHKTGLISERHFKEVLPVEFKRAQRYQQPLSLLLVDVDDFKGINDSTSYAFGDAVLRHVAKILKTGTRDTDYAARYGGDEFVVLLPHTSPAEAVQTAMRLRKKVAQQLVQSRGFDRIATLSVGIDCYDGRTDSSPPDMLARANRALHEAKRRGKNQVWLYSNDEQSRGAAGGELRADA